MASSFKTRAEAIVNVVADKFDEKVRIVEIGPTAAWFDKQGVGLSRMHLKEITERMGDKCVKGVVYHEAGHALLSDLAVLDAFKNKGGGRVFSSAQEKALVMGIMNPGEDIRIEERLSESYEGVAVELKRFMANTSEWIAGRIDKEPTLSKIGKAMIFKARYPELAEPFMKAVDEKYHPTIEKYAEKFKKLSSTEDAFMTSVKMACALKDVYESDDELPPPEGSGGGEGEGEEDGDGETEGMAGRGTGGSKGKKGKKSKTKDFLDDMVGDGSSMTSMDGSPLETETAGGTTGSILDKSEDTLKKEFKSEKRDAEEKFEAKIKDTGSIDFPAIPVEFEKDVDLEGTYLICPGAESNVRPADGGGAATYSAERTEARGDVRTLVRRLKDLFILQKKGRFGGSYDEGTHIAMSKAYKILYGDYTIFQKKIKESERDTGILLLCDLSGSMGGSKVDMLRQTVTILAEVLFQLGVPFEVLGFTTSGSSGEYSASHRETGLEMRYDDLLHTVIKGFDEPLSPRIKDRIGAMDASSENWDGEALVWAYNRLKKTPFKTKHLWVLSDGLPCGGSSHKGQAKFLAEVSAAVGKKVNLMGIGYMHHGVKRFYSKYILVNRMEDLPAMLVTKVKELLVRKAVA